MEDEDPFGLESDRNLAQRKRRGKAALE